MKFGTKAARLQHPLACLIPENLWVGFPFYEELPDEFISLMQTAPYESSIESIIERIVWHDKPKEKRTAQIRAFLMIAVSHPDMDPMVLHSLLVKLLPDQLHYFQAAFFLGRLDLIERLIHCYSHIELFQRLNDRDNYLFNALVESGHQHVLHYIKTKVSPEKLQKMFDLSNFYAFKQAINTGDIDALRNLEQKVTAEQLQKMNAANDFAAFRIAAQKRHLHILRYLEEKAPEQLQKMIAANDFEVFRETASSGYLDVLHYLERKVSPEQLQQILMADEFKAFRMAAQKGHVHVLIYLELKMPHQLKAMITAQDYEALRLAAENGHVAVLHYLEMKIKTTTSSYLELMGSLFTGKDSFTLMLESINVPTMKLVVQRGHLDVLRYLAKLAREQLEQAITDDDFYAIRMAVRERHLDVLYYLENRAPEQLPKIIAAKNFEIFRKAAFYGHLDVLHYLENRAPEQLPKIIAAKNFEIFREAALYGHLDVLHYLESRAPALQLQSMLEAESFEAFTMAAKKGHHAVIAHLLTHTCVFSYAEQHLREYGRHVRPYVANTIQALRAQKQTQEHVRANAVFDVGNEEARHLFYLLRHLIRLNDPTLRDELLFLLEIPSVKRLAHQAITPNQPNELIRLALSMNNQTAAELLLTIPAVRYLAETNNYYRREQRGTLDLRALAQNRESSMTVLSQGEQHRLKSVIERYQPLLQTVGVSQCMDDLRNTLIARYEAHPATISLKNDDGSEQFLPLPATWDEFQKLNLTAAQRQEALITYYQNPNHSAWRYLSKPNPWMHQRANYVCVDEHKPSDKWSTFEEYQPLISILYLTAIDEQTPGIDGYTLDTRLEHFIEELAYIGRSHNWDKTRPKINAKGKQVSEEYDDLEADKPSCFSGVKRRLFQSVQGHPLLVFLTKEHVCQELRSFVRTHFQSSITLENREAIKTAWDKGMAGDELSTNDWAALKLLDITTTQQQEFIDLLKQKYQEQWSQDLQFLSFVQQAFVLKSALDAHILNFGHLQPEKFFSKHAASQPGSLSFFAQGTVEDGGGPHIQTKLAMEQGSVI